MTYYNLTSLTADGVNLGEFTWQLNYLSNGWIAYGILIIVGMVSLLILLQRGISLYNAAPISSFLIAIISLLMRIITNTSNQGMVSTIIVSLLWGVFFITMLIRVMVKDN